MNIKKFRRKALDFIYELTDPKAPNLNDEQKKFAQWNSFRLGISLQESENRLIACIKQFRKGLSGGTFRDYCDKNHTVFSPFFGDTENELIDSYQFHAPLHFLRMLGYQQPTISSTLSTQLKQNDRLDVLDLGCGLAHLSRKIVSVFEKPHELMLYDVPTIRKDYLFWVCEKENLNMTFHESLSPDPPTNFPHFNVAIVTEFFEHVPNPEKWLKALENSAKRGAILITNTNDHQDEFMHVSPDLQKVRARLKKIGAYEIQKNSLFKFP